VIGGGEGIWGDSALGLSQAQVLFLISWDFSFVVAVVVLGCNDVVCVFLSSSL